MKRRRKIAVIVFALLAAGAIRVPLEISLMAKLRAAKLLPTPLAIDVRDKIGQTSSAVALGGLRTLVATFLNLRAYTDFTELRWRDLESNFDTIVDLAPSTQYYWDTGSWHLAYNAGSFYLTDESLPPLRRRELWRAYVRKGRAFLERGIRNNPTDWTLQTNLGNLLSDRFKIGAFPDRIAALNSAVEAYQAAAGTGNAPAYVPRNWFYCLARIPGRESEALAFGEKLLANPANNRTPSFMAMIYVLRMRQNPQQDGPALVAKLFKNDSLAYNSLSAIWLGKNEGPIDGLAVALQALETKLSIPWEKSILNPVNHR